MTCLRQLLIVCLLGSKSLFAFMPTDSIGITKQDGKFYIKYLVEPGETVYRISSKFGIPVSDLLDENPELEKGLKTGQVLLIPYMPDKRPSSTSEEEVNSAYHTVEKGESYNSISKRYNIPVNDLLKLNNIELKAGQRVIIARTGATVSAKQREQFEKSKGTNTPTDSKSAESKPLTSPVRKDTSDKSSSKSEISERTAATVQAEKLPISTDQASENSDAAYSNTVKKVLIVPFDPYLYFSDADDEIAGVSHVHRSKVRQAFRRRLNAYLEPKGYESIHLMGGGVKDSITDLNRVYSSISYTYDNVMMSGVRPEKPEITKTNGHLKKTGKKTEQTIESANLQSRSAQAKDEGKYFAVKINEPGFFRFFNGKYQPDYYIFVSQFEVKTNYENCLDRATQNYERSFVTHFSIFDKSGKQISGGRIKNNYESGNNHLEKILADNIPVIADKIMSELPTQ